MDLRGPQVCQTRCQNRAARVPYVRTDSPDRNAPMVQNAHQIRQRCTRNPLDVSENCRNSPLPLILE